MGEPTCKIAQENGGTVPLDCLFGCSRGCVHDSFEHTSRDPRCNRCGSTDVRWRQQTGRWVLFSSQPGVVHVCSAPNADAFDVIEE